MTGGAIAVQIVQAELTDFASTAHPSPKFWSKGSIDTVICADSAIVVWALSFLNHAERRQVWHENAALLESSCKVFYPARTQLAV